MAIMAKKHSEKLETLKKNVEQSALYFRDNYKRFNEFFKFVFNTALTSDDLSTLAALQKPNIEFGILESFISRLRGEFAEYDPFPKVMAADGAPPALLKDPKYLETLRVVEDHFREVFDNATNDCLSYNIFTDLLAGGFSAVKIYTEYVSEMSFEQNIKCQRVFDPTLTGFDPMARESHKGDGMYCYEIVPKTKQEFEDEFGKIKRGDISFTRGVAGQFNWSYKQQQEDIVLVCNYFEKQMKREKIVKLTNGATILKKHYEPLVKFMHQLPIAQQPPLIVEERYTMIESIHRYRFCENMMLDEDSTDYKYLPIIFIDGNSVVMREQNNGVSTQMTRPYVYHARGIQRLKNFAGQTVANEIENMKMNTWVASKDSIPAEYEDAYINPQKASVLVWNEFLDGDPNIRNSPPREVQRTQTPEIVYQTFSGADNVAQVILGSYDAQQGNMGNQDLSGKAIQYGALQSNTAAVPYLMGYIKGLNRICNVYLDLLPKYYVTPRSIPVREANGKRSYKLINKKDDEQSVFFNFDPNHLQVKVEAGVNSSMQKQMALEQIVRLMGTSEQFSNFINSQGLETLLDNIEIRGIEELKEKAEQYMDKLRQAEEQAAQNPQPDPTQMLLESQEKIEMAKVEQRREESEGQLSIDSAKVAIDEQKAYTEFLKAMSVIKSNAKKAELEELRHRDEAARTAVESTIELVKEINDYSSREV